MIGYIDDFALMLIVILGSLPLLLLVRVPRRAAGAGGGGRLAEGAVTAGSGLRGRARGHLPEPLGETQLGDHLRRMQRGAKLQPGNSHRMSGGPLRTLVVRVPVKLVARRHSQERQLRVNCGDFAVLPRTAGIGATGSIAAPAPMPALPSKAVVFRNHTSAARTARIGIFTGGGMIPPSSSPQPSSQCGPVRTSATD